MFMLAMKIINFTFYGLLLFCKYMKKEDISTQIVSVLKTYKYEYKYLNTRKVKCPNDLNDLFY